MYGCMRVCPPLASAQAAPGWEFVFPVSPVEHRISSTSGFLSLLDASLNSSFSCSPKKSTFGTAVSRLCIIVLSDVPKFNGIRQSAMAPALTNPTAGSGVELSAGAKVVPNLAQHRTREELHRIEKEANEEEDLGDDDTEDDEDDDDIDEDVGDESDDEDKDVHNNSANDGIDDILKRVCCLQSFVLPEYAAPSLWKASQ